MSQKAVWVRQDSGGDTKRDEGGSGAGAPQVDVRRLRFATEVESRIDTLPPFPTILSELIGLTNSEKSAASDLRTCLEKDPVLTARLLKLANSAFYSPRVPVMSVQQAVVMLGHMTVRSLAMAAATLKFLGRGADAYGMAAGGLWMHSYASAELARELARTLSWPDEAQDAVYVGALLHDIGKIVLADFIALAARGEQWPESHRDGEHVEQWETRLTGFTHCGVGEKIAEKWRLAPLTTGCIHHHHLTRDVPAEFSREVMLVSLADIGVRRLAIGIAQPDEDPDREALSLEGLGIPEAQFRGILEGYAEKGAGAQDLFSNLGGAT